MGRLRRERAGTRGPQPTSGGPPGLAGTVLRGASLGGLGYGVSQALTLGTYIVLARLITPEEFGDFAAATVLIGFTLLVTETGMMSAIVQRRSRLEEAANTAFLATLVGGFLFTGILFALAPLIGNFFGSDEVTGTRSCHQRPDPAANRELRPRWSFVAPVLVPSQARHRAGAGRGVRRRRDPRRHLRSGRVVARSGAVREPRRRGDPPMGPDAVAASPEPRFVRHVARAGGLRAPRLPRHDDPARRRAVGRRDHRQDPRRSGAGAVPLRVPRRVHPLPADPRCRLVLPLPGFRADRRTTPSE